jgi:hypothetical protein
MLLLWHYSECSKAYCKLLRMKKVLLVSTSALTTTHINIEMSYYVWSSTPKSHTQATTFLTLLLVLVLRKTHNYDLGDGTMVQLQLAR